MADTQVHEWAGIAFDRVNHVIIVDFAPSPAHGSHVNTDDKGAMMQATHMISGTLQRGTNVAQRRRAIKTLLAGAAMMMGCATRTDKPHAYHPPVAENRSRETIETSLGPLHVSINRIEQSVPIVFLHGVYFDHHMWDDIVAQFPDATTIAVDMPLHGMSDSGVRDDWDMDNVSNALIEVLDGLGIEACYAIGHSWGSMTILRAAAHHPERFVAVGLANMPLAPGDKQTQRLFARRHRALMFRRFYTKQASKALFSEASLDSNPALAERLAQSMDRLSAQDIKQTDRAVITHVDDARPYIERLDVPALALIGADDYVGQSKALNTRTVPGGHVSPLEAPDPFVAFVQDVVSLATTASPPATNRGLTLPHD